MTRVQEKPVQGVNQYNSFVKRVAVLGSTGSIGTQTLDIIAQHPDRVELVALAAGSNHAFVAEQAARFGVRRVALYDKEAANQIGAASGMDGLIEVATAEDVDIVVVSVAGVIGLLPTIEAIRAGKQIALASKEVLVAAGELVMPLVQAHGVTMTPIDSEHSALFQCLQGYTSDQVRRLILTASGGPFRGRTRAELQSVTRAQALNHPTWAMGGKITIDSATLMNKGLEIIEARWLFGVEMDQVEVQIHPQSVLHSLVEFRDGSMLGQLGWPDMRLPIQYALLYPERKENTMRPWNPVETPTLTFEPVDEDTFRSLRIARAAASAGGTMPCAFNAANEAAVNAFLSERCAFLEIMDVVEEVMSDHVVQPVTLEGLLETDRWARERVEARVAAGVR